MLTSAHAVARQQQQKFSNILFIKFSRKENFLIFAEEFGLFWFKIMGENGARRPKYYTANEVSIHNTLKDIWVSFLGKVYDLTPLCKKYAGQTLVSCV